MIENKDGCNCYVTGSTPEREQFFKSVCKDGRIPIACPLPTGRLVHKDLKGKVPMTKVALDRLTEEEKENLICQMMARFDLPRDMVEQDLEKRGCPIRLDAAVSVCWCSLHSRMVL